MRYIQLFFAQGTSIYVILENEHNSFLWTKASTSTSLYAE
ncbi:unknown [Phocaeicola vulgatus CAG:6]|nr:unknown [Phocaeicola vulgatus CAG:6]